VSTADSFRASEAEGHAPVHPQTGPRTYVVIAAFLLVLTVMEVAVFYIPALARVLVPMLIVLALAKFALVAMFYMHLRFDHVWFLLSSPRSSWWWASSPSSGSSACSAVRACALAAWMGVLARHEPLALAPAFSSGRGPRALLRGRRRARGAGRSWRSSGAIRPGRGPARAARRVGGARLAERAHGPASRADPGRAPVWLAGTPAWPRPRGCGSPGPRRRPRPDVPVVASAWPRPC
jgi:caa(3)-type oxidase subunit IV